MVLHQRVDLAVLPLLDLVDLRLAAKVKFVSQRPHLLLVLVLNLIHLSHKVTSLLREFLVLFLVMCECKLKLFGKLKVFGKF